MLARICNPGLFVGNHSVNEHEVLSRIANLRQREINVGTCHGMSLPKTQTAQI
jgi:hypothetical protein